MNHSIVFCFCINGKENIIGSKPSNSCCYSHIYSDLVRKELQSIQEFGTIGWGLRVTTFLIWCSQNLWKIIRGSSKDRWYHAGLALDTGPIRPAVNDVIFLLFLLWKRISRAIIEKQKIIYILNFLSRKYITS